MLRKRYELIGQRFGLGTVIEEKGIRTIGKGKYPRQNQEWLLKCDCGKEYITTTQHLIGKRTKSCGCLRRNNLIGKRFGKGTVISFIGHRLRGDSSERSCCMWKLLCDCGNEYEGTSEFLTNGDCSSCGCLKSNFHNIPNGKNDAKATIGRYITRVKHESIRRNHKFLIDKDYLLELYNKQNKKCALSGVDIMFENKTISLDRIDNTKDYIEGNVQWVHRTVNFMKNTLGQADFVSWCQKIYLHKSISNNTLQT
jgi:hypothetical protein